MTSSAACRSGARATPTCGSRTDSPRRSTRRSTPGSRLLPGGPELDQRDLSQRRPAARRGRAVRSRRGQDRRHGVSLRAAGARSRLMALRVSEQAFRSDTGRQRTANEDAYYASAPVYAVADGMGGAQAGEVASRIAADSFEPAVRSGESPEAYLRAIAQEANRQIHSLAEHDSTRSGMGTTLTAALVEGDEVALAHVGDSRAYVWRDGALR